MANSTPSDVCFRSFCVKIASLSLLFVLNIESHFLVANSKIKISDISTRLTKSGTNSRSIEISLENRQDNHNKMRDI